MANNLSDYAENKLLDHLLGEAAFTMPTVRVALFSADPGEAGSLTNEIDAAGRKPWSGAAASGGATANDADIVFDENPGASYTVTHVALIDSATPDSGNVLASGPITNKTIGTGDQYRIKAGDLDVALS